MWSVRFVTLGLSGWSCSDKEKMGLVVKLNPGIIFDLCTIPFSYRYAGTICTIPTHPPPPPKRRYQLPDEDMPVSLLEFEYWKKLSLGSAAKPKSVGFSPFSITPSWI